MKCITLKLKLGVHYEFISQYGINLKPGQLLTVKATPGKQMLRLYYRSLEQVALVEKLTLKSTHYEISTGAVAEPKAVVVDEPIPAKQDKSMAGSTKKRRRKIGG